MQAITPTPAPASRRPSPLDRLRALLAQAAEHLPAHLAEDLLGPGAGLHLVEDLDPRFLDAVATLASGGFSAWGELAELLRRLAEGEDPDDLLEEVRALGTREADRAGQSIPEALNQAIGLGAREGGRHLRLVPPCDDGEGDPPPEAPVGNVVRLVPRLVRPVSVDLRLVARAA